MELNFYTILFTIIVIAYCTYVIIYEKRSVKSKLIEQAALITKYKTFVYNEKAYDKYIEEVGIKENEKYSLPKLKYKCTIEEYNFSGMQYFVINKNENNKKIFYLHGGSYISSPLIFHWIFLDELAKNNNIEIIVPIYPSAPKYYYKESYQKVLGLYNSYFNNNDEITIMGDSAGGGFSLGLAIKIKETKSIKPENVILISPWLDITMNNRKIDKYEKIDPFLSKQALIKAGKLWSRGDNRYKYMLSPIYGNLRNIGKIVIFVGTHELLLPDARKLNKILNRYDISHEYYEYKNLNHVFPLYPIPEAKKVKKIISEILK